MLPSSRTLAKATLLALVAGVTPDALAAGGTPAPVPAPPPVAPPPSGPAPPWAIVVPVKLASIPPRYPRFAVDCLVATPPIAHPFPLQDPTPRTIGNGTQDWPLDANGAYAGTVTVKVFLVKGYDASQARGGGYTCWLRLVDAGSQSHIVGPSEDPSLRPQQGTTFIASVSGGIPL